PSKVASIKQPRSHSPFSNQQSFSKFRLYFAVGVRIIESQPRKLIWLSILLMNTKLKWFHGGVRWVVALGIGCSFIVATAAQDSPDTDLAKTSQAIPWSKLGVKAGADYHGDGMAVSST